MIKKTFHKLIYFWLNVNFQEVVESDIHNAADLILDTVNSSIFIMKIGIKALLFLSLLFVPVQLMTNYPVLRSIPIFKSLNKFIRLFGLMSLREDKGIKSDLISHPSEAIIKKGVTKFDNIESHYDLVIVGSGPGGAMIAYELSKKYQNRVKILIVEEGDNCNRQIQTTPISNRILKTYRSGGLYPIFGSPLLALGVGATLGGGSKVNGGLFWRTPNFVLKKWKDTKAISTEFITRLEENFPYIEKLMNVMTEDSITGYDKDSLILKNVADKEGIKILNARRALKNCQKNNECSAGCPSFSKQSVDLNLIPESIISGANLLLNTRAARINDNKNSLLLISAGLRKNITYHKLFLSCGATETPKLLKKSKLLKRKNIELNLHLNLRTIVEFPDMVNASKGTMFTHQIQEFMEVGYLIMPSNFNSYFLAASIADYADPVIEDLYNKFNYLAMFVIQVKIKSTARLLRSGWNSYDYFFRLKNEDERLIRDGIQKMSKILFSANASKIFLPTSGKNFKIEKNDLEQNIEEISIKDLQFASVHQMSSLPIGKYVGENGQLKQHPNIFVADSSILPTSIGESPQLTVMSFAKNIADTFSLSNLQ